MLPASLSPHKVSRSGKILDSDTENRPKRRRRKRKKINTSPHFTSERGDDSNAAVLKEKKDRKLWKSFLRKRDRGGPQFDTMHWYRKHVLYPMPKIKIKKIKTII